MICALDFEFPAATGLYSNALSMRKGRVMKSLTTVVALLTIPLIATAQSDAAYECRMGELIRRVAVERDGSAPLPCRVAYFKDTEAPGERQVLWNAQNDASYCDARASEFVSRLQGLGWNCTAAAAGPEVATNETSTE